MIRVQIICDKCSTVGTYSDLVEKKEPRLLRNELKKIGWQNVGWADYCPFCQNFNDVFSKKIIKNS